MSANSKIEWTDHTWNPWEGCQKVGPGCDHCYAEARNARFGGGIAVNWGPGAPRRRTSAANWNLPRRWNAQAETFLAQYGRRQRVFCASLADVFDNEVDPEWRTDVFRLILDTPNLDWLLLTKRIGNAHKMMSEATQWINLEAPGLWPIPNLWIGATVVNQAEADRDIPKLQDTPARVRFLSIEPMLGPIALGPDGNGTFGHLSRRSPDGDWTYADYPLEGKRSTKQGQYDVPRIDWVIVGGESGPSARPMHPDWARSLRDQCQAAGVPFLFKQWGEWLPSSDVEDPDERGDSPLNRADREGRSLWLEPDTATEAPRGRDMHPRTQPMIRVGKKAAGRLLDGRTWDEVTA